MSNRKGGRTTQTAAAASRRLQSSAENVKGVIHPAAPWGNTLSLQGSGDGVHPAVPRPCSTSTLGSSQIPPWDKWGAG